MKALAIVFTVFEIVCAIIGYNFIAMFPEAITTGMAEYEFTWSNMAMSTTIEQFVFWLAFTLIAISSIASALVLPIFIKQAWKGTI